MTLTGRRSTMWRISFRQGAADNFQYWWHFDENPVDAHYLVAL